MLWKAHEFLGGGLLQHILPPPHPEHRLAGELPEDRLQPVVMFFRIPIESDLRADVTQR